MDRDTRWAQLRESERKLEARKSARLERARAAAMVIPEGKGGRPSEANARMGTYLCSTSNGEYDWKENLEWTPGFCAMCDDAVDGKRVICPRDECKREYKAAYFRVRRGNRGRL